MTVPAPVVVDPGLVAQPPQRPRHERNVVSTGALATTACVAAGFAAAVTTLSPVQTPSRVAQTFVEAKYAEDWLLAWDLMCSTARDAFGSYATFKESLHYQNEYFMTPSDAEVEIRELEGVSQPGAHGFSVAYRVTSDERTKEWSERGEALVVREDGEFRVCIADRSTGTG